MSIEVTRKSYGKQILYWDSQTASNPVNRNQWWITGFNVQYQNVQADDLEVTITMDCTDNMSLYNDIKKKYKNNSSNEYDMCFGEKSIKILY